jgi:hypothetical protein
MNDHNRTCHQVAQLSLARMIHMCSVQHADARASLTQRSQSEGHHGTERRLSLGERPSNMRAERCAKLS